MTDPNTRPIEVNPDNTAATLGIALRYAITTLGGYFVGKGWIDGDLVQVVSSVALVVAPAIYAWWRSNRQKQALVTLAEAAPDRVAVVK